MLQLNNIDWEKVLRYAASIYLLVGIFTFSYTMSYNIFILDLFYYDWKVFITVFLLLFIFSSLWPVAVVSYYLIAPFF